MNCCRLLAQMSVGGASICPSPRTFSIRAQLLEERGPKLWAEFMDELRETHLGVKRRKTAARSVAQRLQKAYEAGLARKR